MSNLVQCTRCRKVLMNEEYDIHDCRPEIKDSRTIKCSDHYIVHDKYGRMVIGIMGFNGISYEFVEIPEDKEHTKIPYQPKSNTEKTIKDETEPEIMPKI